MAQLDKTHCNYYSSMATAKAVLKVLSSERLAKLYRSIRLMRATIRADNSVIVTSITPVTQGSPQEGVD